MNPKVSPSAKNLVPLPGKKRVFRKPTTGIPSHIKESGISSHIKDGQKAAIANYDLSLLDVVPAAGKDTPMKTKHVHFLPEAAYITGTPADVKQTKVNIGHEAPTSRPHSAPSTPQSGSHKVKKHNGCTSGRSKANSRPDSTEVVSAPTKLGNGSTRRGSVSSQGYPVVAMVQRSNSLPLGHNKHDSSSDCTSRKHHSKPNSPMSKPKEKRSLPATPAPDAATSLTTVSSTRDANNFPAGALQQKTTLSLSSNAPVFLSPTHKNKSCCRNIVALNSSIPKRTERKDPHPQARPETNGIAEKRTPAPQTAVTHSNANEFYQRDNSLSPPTKHKHSRAKSKLASGQGQTIVVNGDVLNGCSPTKRQWRSMETSMSASDHSSTGGTQLSHSSTGDTQLSHSSTGGTQLDKRQRFANVENKDSTNPASPIQLHTNSHKHLDSTNPGSPIQLHTSSHKHLDSTNPGSPIQLHTSSHKHLDSTNPASPIQLHPSAHKHLESTNPTSPIKLHISSNRLPEPTNNGYRYRFIVGDQSLAASSSPSPSINSLSKDVLSAGMYTLPAMSLTARTKRSQSGRLTDDQPGRQTDDQQLLFPFSELSSSSLSVSSSVSTSSSQTRSRRSPSCFGSDCVFGTRQGCVPAKQLAHHENQPVHQLTPASTCQDGDTNRSDSDLPWLPGLLFDDRSAFKATDHKRQSAKARTQSIAASYQLDQCWFCGRPMPGLGPSFSGDLGQADKLVELERRLEEVLSEKTRLLEEQTRLKELETQARRRARHLERQLQESRLTEKSAQEVPVTEVLSTPSKDLDLRAYMESLGHELDTCQHVLVTKHCCRGFLHKMGGHFRLWRRRWFVFDCSRKLVSYFTDKTEKKARGSLSFQTIQEVYMDQPRTVKSPDPKLTFCVKTYHKTFYLMAPSTVAMSMWIDVLLSGAEGYKGCYES
ncbi:hypothetical protein BsWGS_28489 [Bradybaena similaris]